MSWVEEVRLLRVGGYPLLTIAAAAVLLLSSWLTLRAVHVCWQIYESRRNQQKAAGTSLLRAIKQTPPLKTLVVLGSGGHTTEMLSMVKGMNSKLYQPIVFIKAATDTTSAMRIDKFIDPRSPYQKDNITILDIPRSREVGQSYLTSVWTTLRATWTCAFLVVRLSPDLILCNGPGTCLPIAVMGLIWRILGIMPSTTTVFVESFCRVQTLSLTGKIMYWLADLFIVHWEELQEKYPSSILSSQFVSQRTTTH
mmetsp:Transcript_17836/g.48506  ORF Transcript_17836/g.48506 Transcript_17836/m.48506 type:complete len:253 (-) Transcript_17836:1460-2218(-)